MMALFLGRLSHIASGQKSPRRSGRTCRFAVWLRKRPQASVLRVADRTALELSLVAKPGAPRGYLDTAGFTCVALFSTSVAEDPHFLAHRGVTVSETGTIRVNGQELELFFAQGPAGELVEVIGLAGRV